MGSAIGDYDNDGDLDWFVTSIRDPNGIVEGNWGITGNRLYRKRRRAGNSATDDRVRVGQAGARRSPTDNDTHLDLVHVNGWFDDE